MSTFTVRHATSKDQASIRRLIRSAHLNPFRLHWRNFIVVETLHGDVIGCGQIRTHRHNSHELSSLVVAKGWRGQGIAKMIVTHLLKNNPSPIWLICRSGLVEFYRRFGFREVEGIPSMPWVYKLVRLWASIRLQLTDKGGYLAVMIWARAE
jgi:amino-acid N-acetyltransferase